MTDVVCGDMIAKTTGRLGHYPFLRKEGKGLAIVSRHDTQPTASGVRADLSVFGIRASPVELNTVAIFHALPAKYVQG